MTAPSIEDSVRRFIAEDLGSGVLADDAPLMDLGAVDSLKIFRLIAFLEAEFAVALEPASLSAGSFATIRSIAALVRRAQNNA